MTGPIAQMLPDGCRLHLQHGPIDLIIGAHGPKAEVQAAYDQAAAFFETVLPDLVAVLPVLRRPLAETHPIGRVADRMVQAVAQHQGFVTPMAAVAGSVADAVLEAMTQGPRVDRAFVNNGGDIAVWLTPGAELTAAGGPGLTDRIRMTYDAPSRGLATSGWRGRSHSLGIADAVSVLARNAAEADVAATLIANAVDLPGHPAIERCPAKNLFSDSDLGDRLVTTNVGPLMRSEATQALAKGQTFADKMCRSGLIHGAVLWLAGQVVVAGAPLLTTKDPIYA